MEPIWALPAEPSIGPGLISVWMERIWALLAEPSIGHGLISVWMETTAYWDSLRAFLSIHT